MRNSKRVASRNILIFSLVLLLNWSAPHGLAASSKIASGGLAATGTGGGAAHAVIERSFARQPLSFIANHGQIDQQVAFYTEGRGTRLYFTEGGVTFSMLNAAAKGSEVDGQRWTAKLDFVGARKGVRPTGEQQDPMVVSYFRGSKDNWKSGLPTYSRIRYANLWPGIDLVYTGGENKLKYQFEVHPGADPGQIQLAYRGASLRMDGSGILQITTPCGSLEDEAPLSYQEQNGKRIQVSTSYELRGAGNTNEGQVCGFRIASYDRSQPLLIDPEMVAYAGYIGGNFVDTIFGIAVDSSGAAYVAGYTESTASDNFPLMTGPGLTFNLNKQFLFWTAFVAKVRPDGTGLEYCGYIDGSGHQIASAIAVDNTGAAYVTGYTTSDQTTFPVVVGPSLKYSGGTLTTNNYEGDAFAAKVKPDGTGLEYCGYIGGQGDEAGYGIAIDSSGNAYITGQTTSPGPGQAGATVPFPAKGGPSLTNSGAPSYAIPDAFIAEVKSDGTGLVYAGFIGGTGMDLGLGVAVDNTGAAYVTGVTNSQPSGFPQLKGGPSLKAGGAMDAFVAKVKSDGSALDYCGYIGGSASDEGMGIAVDSSGNAYVTGETSSDQTTFPVKVGPKLTYSGSDGMFGDAFVAKVSADGSSLIYCGYIGGSGGDIGYRIALDSEGSAYITGSTNSPTASFPVTAATGRAATYSGGSIFGDAFVAKVDPSGASLLYAGYLGGSDDDSGVGIAVDAAGNAYIGGATLSSETTFPVIIGPFLQFKPGIFDEADAFVAKLTGLPAPASGFSLGFAQSSVTAVRMSKVGITINIARQGTFSGPVTITPPLTTPTGVVVKLQQTTVSGNSLSFKIKVKARAQPGTDQLTFTGKDSTGAITQTATLNLTVQ